MTALFCNSHGVRPSFDRQFGRVIRYDVPLLDGYESRFLRNVAIPPRVTAAGLINPDVVRILMSGEFDALVVHGYAYITSVLSFLSPRSKTRLLFRGDSNLRSLRSPATLALKRYVLRSLFRRVDQFLAIGSLNRAYYEAYGVPPDRITTAPYSVDNEFFYERSAEARANVVETRRNLGLPDRRTLFVFAAKLIGLKRPFDLLDAFARADVADRAGLVFAGDGALLEALRIRTRDLGLTEVVKFLGFRNQTELPNVYGAGDVIVLPSDSEAWGLSVNEAMACGAAAFVSDQVGAGPDLVPDRDCTFAVGDVARLAAMMRRAATDAEWLAAIKGAASKRIAAWSLDATVDGVLEGIESARLRAAGVARRAGCEGVITLKQARSTWCKS